MANNAPEFGKHLLIVHGNTHAFTMDQPLRHPKDNKKSLDGLDHGIGHFRLAAVD
jgi:hypothetical protein